MMKKSLLIITILLLSAVALSACARATAPNFAEIPAGKAYANGQEIYFSHTEVSDAGVAEVLTNMMKSPVVVVPSLAEVPENLTSPVYVFRNGVAGSGPLSFQADVFPNQPGDEGYTPLRRIVFVDWTDESQAKELKSEQDVLALVEQGALTLEESGIVVNMPFIVWAGGKR
jgi:hypothetical protein